jgi:alpha-glucosidase (family GH31 glycosyl hydrolase)
MVYDFPDAHMETVHDQYMVGDRRLVAPVIEEGATSRTVRFPAGRWQGDDDTVVEGPCEAVIDAPLERLPHYERCD